MYLVGPVGGSGRVCKTSGWSLKKLEERNWCMVAKFRGCTSLQSRICLYHAPNVVHVVPGWILWGTLSKSFESSVSVCTGEYGRILRRLYDRISWNGRWSFRSIGSKTYGFGGSAMGSKNSLGLFSGSAPELPAGRTNLKQRSITAHKATALERKIFP